MTRDFSISWILAALLPCAAFPVHAEDLARIATHSHRYGGQIRVSAYDDPLLKGVTCYVSRSHDENTFGGSTPPTPDVEVSCHQVGKLVTPNRIPRQAQVFDASVDPIFGLLHIFRILDSNRLTVLYFSYTENELAGDLPGHVDVIRLPVRGRPTGE
ncbi:CreA family protein [Paraburkholderia caribensis]|uniref:CreA family protein n=1 Tax=Paraburkholderia caribensis TaxID=75105 RepID=A0A9Q6WMW7_9BURK|nr:CreA family protein [Paraburkholderia caribensis]MCO4877178.1 CreA family protein [Paraburkholderia caribensis]PTB29023.1 CreA family protein [Paraburkholderia caribensis]QLB64338.1 CreA family protein [Paraburkholderia caribensis]